MDEKKFISLERLKDFYRRLVTKVEDMISSIVVTWSDVENKPEEYKPEPHTHTIEDITDFPDTLPNPEELTLRLEQGTQDSMNATEYVYDGSKPLSVTFNYSTIGAMQSGSVAYVQGDVESGNLIGTLTIGSSSYQLYSPVIDVLEPEHGGTGTITGHIEVDTNTGSMASSTLSFGGSFTGINSITRDDYGHVTTYTPITYTLPSNTADEDNDGLMSSDDYSTLYHVYAVSGMVQLYDSVEDDTDYAVLLSSYDASQSSGQLWYANFSDTMTYNPSTDTLSVGHVNGLASLAEGLDGFIMLQADLSSGSLVGFNSPGTYTIGTTGTLPITKGGTGTTDGTITNLSVTVNGSSISLNTILSNCLFKLGEGTGYVTVGNLSEWVSNGMPTYTSSNNIDGAVQNSIEDSEDNDNVAAESSDDVDD